MSKPFGWSTIYGHAGKHSVPYMTRIWIGQLRLHIFYRGDNDPDCHDHPWDFWTFPFTAYVEEVIFPIQDTVAESQPEPKLRYQLVRQVVPAFKWTFRPATHTHRVIGPVGDKVVQLSAIILHTAKELLPIAVPGKIVTLVWRGKVGRNWGFLKNRNNQWCWVGCKDYIWQGGKDAPCKDE